jgi:2-dehydropantoate 2-reductase
MGLLMGARLIESGAKVMLLGRDEETASLINREGIILKDESGERAIPASATLSPSDAGPARLVLVLVKSYDTKSVAPLLHETAGEEGFALTLQNGLGNAEVLAESFTPERLLAGSTSHGATRLGPNRVFHAGAGDTSIGPFGHGKDAPERARDAAGLLTKAGFECSAVQDVGPVLWKKLMVNVAINPITALTDRTNGCIIEDDNLAALAETVVLEACRVAGAAGVDLDPGEETARAKEVARRTADNVSSMLADVRAGRKTEIEAIAGALIREGERRRVAAPTLKTLYLMVKARERWTRS